MNGLCTRTNACNKSLRIPEFVYGIGTEEVIRVGGPPTSAMRFSEAYQIGLQLVPALAVAFLQQDVVFFP